MAYIETIVYTQDELNSAVENGANSIALCDAEFELPCNENMIYIAIGDVNASISLSRYDYIIKNITCIGFTPALANGKTIIPCKAKMIGSIKNSYNSHSSAYYFTSGSMNYGSYIYGSYQHGSGSGRYSSYLYKYVDKQKSEELKKMFIGGYGIHIV